MTGRDHLIACLASTPVSLSYKVMCKLNYKEKE